MFAFKTALAFAHSSSLAVGASSSGEIDTLSTLWFVSVDCSLAASLSSPASRSPGGLSSLLRTGGGLTLRLGRCPNPLRYDASASFHRRARKCSFPSCFRSSASCKHLLKSKHQTRYITNGGPNSPAILRHWKVLGPLRQQSLQQLDLKRMQKVDIYPACSLYEVALSRVVVRQVVGPSISRWRRCVVAGASQRDKIGARWTRTCPSQCGRKSRWHLCICTL